MSGNMAFSMVFQVIDAATAPIKGIAAALAEPAGAAAAVGEAGEKGAARLGGGMDRARDTVRRLGESFHHPMERMAEFAKAAGEASEKFSHSFAGMGALVAEGFSVKDVAGDEEFFQRMRINFDMTAEATDQLKESINGAGVEFGVTQDSMMKALSSFQDVGGSAEVYADNAKTIAGVTQLMGGSAEQAGEMFGVLQTKMHLKGPDQFRNAVGQLREQFLGIKGGLPAFAEVVDRVGDSMQALGMKGPQAVAALGAVAAIATKGAGGNARKGMSAAEGWIDDLTHRGYQAQLSQALGEDVTDKNGRVMDLRVLMRKMAAKYAEAMKLPENQQQNAIMQLDSMMGPSAARMFKSVAGEIKSTGHSDTMDRILAAKGDDASGAELMKKAAEAGQTLSASMNRLKASMAEAAEAVFAGPLEVFADALGACGGVLGKVVIGLGALAMVGHTITWIGGAINGFKLLRATLLAFRFQGLITSLSGIATGFVPVIAASWAWAAAMLANPVTWIVLGVVAAVALVGVGIYALYTHWTAIWKAIGGSVMTAIFPVVILAVAIKTTLGAAWDWVGDKVAAVVDWASQKLDWLFDKLRHARDWIGDTTRPAREAVRHAAIVVAHSAPVQYATRAAHQTSAAVGDATKRAVAYFETQGWSHEQAAGIAANLKTESSFRPDAVGDSGHAYGLGQWHPDRQAAFAQWAGHDIRQSTMEEQLGFANWEMTKGGEQAAGRALAQTSTAAEAGAVVSQRYERPADRDGEASRRAAAAQAIAALAPQPLSRAPAVPGPAPKSEHLITVRLDGLPKGATAKVASPSDGLSLQLDRGPAMAAG